MLSVLMLQGKQLVKTLPKIIKKDQKVGRKDISDILCCNAAGEAASEDSSAVPCHGFQEPQGSSSWGCPRAEGARGLCQGAAADHLPGRLQPWFGSAS